MDINEMVHIKIKIIKKLSIPTLGRNVIVNLPSFSVQYCTVIKLSHEYL